MLSVMDRVYRHLCFFQGKLSNSEFCLLILSNPSNYNHSKTHRAGSNPTGQQPNLIPQAKVSYMDQMAPSCYYNKYQLFKKPNCKDYTTTTTKPCPTNWIK